MTATDYMWPKDQHLYLMGPKDQHGAKGPTHGAKGPNHGAKGPKSASMVLWPHTWGQRTQ